jgi:hypothetical protein
MNLTRSFVVVAAALAFAAACGPSSLRIKKARSSAYQADFTVVWNAAVEAVKSNYPNLKVEDAEGGLLVTDWTKVERVADSQATQSDRLGGMDNSGGIFFRLKVQLVGKEPPYLITVDGEAARYRPDYTMLQPFKRGADDEPSWVNGRIDAMYVAIFDRLERYAVPADQVRRSEPAPAEAPTSEAEVGSPEPIAPPGAPEPAAPSDPPAPAPTP